MWARASRSCSGKSSSRKDLYLELFREGFVGRSFTRITNFKPDHTSFTAHTFTSTSPANKPILRTSFSFRSVGTPEVFLGQLTQSIPAGANRRAKLGNRSFI